MEVELGREGDLPNKISLEALPVSYFIVRSKPLTLSPGVQWLAKSGRPYFAMRYHFHN